jgi:beta-carotene hydroxylase
MGLDSMTDSQMYDYKFSELSHDKEKEIARAFMGRIEWEMIVIAFTQFFIWCLVWYLVISSTIPLWLGFFISLISTSFAYLPSHAGQHGHLSGSHKNLEWVNSFVGQISLIPLARSHELLKVLHMKHHAHTNDPEKDPDYFHTHVDSWFEAALRVHNQGSDERIEKMVNEYCDKDPEFKKA